jgi:phosphinothricin acetyltransferase
MDGKTTGLAVGEGGSGRYAAAMSCRIMPMTGDDVDAVLRIFNHFVEHSFAAYPSAPVGPDLFQRLCASAAAYPVFTVWLDGEVVGFGMLKPFHPADSFRRTAEVGYFLKPQATGKGLGTALLAHLVEEARARGVRTLVASISSLNEQSLAFHRKHGFEEVGRFPRVGEKLGREFDVVYVQKRID